MAEDKKRNPIDEYAALKQMMATEGWKFFREKVDALADGKLALILNIETETIKRNMYVCQFNLLGEVMKIPVEFEEEATIHQEENKEPDTHANI